MSNIDLQVQGMSCDSCIKHVTQALQHLSGVSGVEVDLQSGRVRVSGALQQGIEPLVSALTVAGYPAKLATAEGAQLDTSGCCSGGRCCG